MNFVCSKFVRMYIYIYNIIGDRSISAAHLSRGLYLKDEIAVITLSCNNNNIILLLVRRDGYCRAQSTGRFLFPLPPPTSGRSVARRKRSKSRRLLAKLVANIFRFPPPRTISYEVASGVYDVRIYTRRSL